MSGRIFTVPPGVPFLTAIAKALMSGELLGSKDRAFDPIDLPDVTLMLPTRRAARAVEAAFLDAAGTKAVLMPRIKPIAEGNEDLSILYEGAGLSGGLDAAPVIPALTEILALMQLIGHWRDRMAAGDSEERSLSSPAQAASLAADLKRLMDMLETEGVTLDSLAAIVPDTFAAHWEKTIEFLQIVTTYWPAYLADNGVVTSAARRNALIMDEAARLNALGPLSPVIVAGVTGSIPATVTLMRAVAALQNGIIVLPALDLDLDAESWETIAPGHAEHPQFGMKKLLGALGVDRASVQTLAAARITPTQADRNAVFSEAMRPAATTAKWRDAVERADPRRIKAALENVSLIEAANAHEEAEAIALILRHTVETPGRTAALVSPDRLLARRVAVRLATWGIRVDDSAGRPFGKTVPGTFLQLVIDAAVSELAPVELMALVKHPLCRLGLKPFEVRSFARNMELALFRSGPYLGRGSSGLAAALAMASSAPGDNHRSSHLLREKDQAGVTDLVNRISEAFAPLETLYELDQSASLAAFASAHLAAAEALCRLPDVEQDTATDDLASPLWRGEAGAAAHTFFSGLLDAATPAIEIQPVDYAELYGALLARENVRERTPVHPRISIWGPFEARLQQPDVIILGSLNDKIWPEPADPGAWLNRPMRQDLGLPSPEEEIGRSAHDFISLCGADRVFLTRAAKTDGVPAVASRWLMRLQALLDGMGLADVLHSREPWLLWARSRDLIDPTERERVRIAPPAPTPPLSLRPRKMSVSTVEAWITNPYAIFAGKILRLSSMPELGAPPDAGLRGGLVHQVMAAFTREFPNRLPDDVRGHLQRIALRVLETYTGHARVAAFWLPRLERFLDWFATTEAERRDGVVLSIGETSGALILDLAGGPFTLTARADRLDRSAAGLIITDYKTGKPPQNAQVLDGRSPQLPLEAAIAEGPTGFAECADLDVAALRYIHASGGEPPGEQRMITGDIRAIAANALTGLRTLIDDFDRLETPYRAVQRASFSSKHDDYALLARVAEWSSLAEKETASP